MIVAITSVKDEAPIIRQTVTHLLGNGVDQVIISDGGSTDGTQDEILALPDNVAFVTQDGPFDQSVEMTRLAHCAYALGATWVIPFDADEFWCPTDGASVAEVLNGLPDTTTRCYTPVFAQLTWDSKVAHQKLHGKVAFRPTPDMHLHWGNHHVDNVPGDDIHGVLHIRELQYRDLTHFLAKIARSQALYDSWDVPTVHGGHMRILCAMSPDERAQAYADYAAQPSIIDPIPYRGT